MKSDSVCWPVPTSYTIIYTADKACVDLEQMWRMNLAGAFFVMRPKNNMKFEVVRVLNGDDKPSAIRSDYIVRLVVMKSKNLYLCKH